MATLKRTVTRQVEIEVPTFMDLPLVGDSHLFQLAVHCVLTNWEGDVSKVLVNKTPNDLNHDDFMPNDKGTFSVWGVNSAGNVIFGMARYDADPKAEDELEREPHYYIKAANSTKRFLANW